MRGATRALSLNPRIDNQYAHRSQGDANQGQIPKDQFNLSIWYTREGEFLYEKFQYQAYYTSESGGDGHPLGKIPEYRARAEIV